MLDHKWYRTDVDTNEVVLLHLDGGMDGGVNSTSGACGHGTGTKQAKYTQNFIINGKLLLKYNIGKKNTELYRVMQKKEFSK